MTSKKTLLNIKQNVHFPPVCLCEQRLKTKQDHMAAPTKRVLVPIGNGTEEIEAVCVIDVLRRASAEVVVASVEAEKTVVCARKTKIEADVLIQDVQDQSFDLIACPGGMPGAEKLRDSAILTAMLKKQVNNPQPSKINFYFRPLLVLSTEQFVLPQL